MEGSRLTDPESQNIPVMTSDLGTSQVGWATADPLMIEWTRPRCNTMTCGDALESSGAR